MTDCVKSRFQGHVLFLSRRDVAVGRRMLLCEMPRQFWIAGLPFPGLSSGLLTVPQLGPANANKTNSTKPSSFQSEKLPDPANSNNNIIFIFMSIPGFYYQNYYLSSCRTYWENLDALDPGSTVKNVFVEAVILLL